MQIFDSATTAARLPFDRLIPALEKMFVQGCTVPRRHNHILHDTDGAKDSLLIMPAWQDDYLGIKHVTIYPGNGSRGLPGLHSTYTLYNAVNGVPLALIDGDQITVRRTAAASALAASFLARQDARKLLVVGAGNVATALAPAYAAVRDIRQVRVWDRYPEKAATLAAALATQGFDAAAAPDLDAAVREADIVTCATLSQEPLVRRACLRPGTHVDLIGGFQPFMRESDDATFADTSVFVDTEEALDKAGDLLSPIAAGVFRRDGVLATLEALCRRAHPGRRAADEITVYKAVGAASEDLAAAMLVYAGD
ncbi:ornithine cyclodeaminase family protein [Bordetella bronchialis]|uniref:Ornithine cyclodeaminase n=1 Tax=Bordetella bronchialis TaxID=463025 RepID=A0A193FH95_9BORD|nr:ornithine cyclodeaminase family protein [Bordetella bronchialis]ANN67035.1 ornithine cyclodeaminase [Bordetella bronchialis]ANN72112.1 ornithine cyclodeaminase [Bordetella bronchialis]